MVTGHPHRYPLETPGPRWVSTGVIALLDSRFDIISYDLLSLANVGVVLQRQVSFTYSEVLGERTLLHYSLECTQGVSLFSM